MEGVGIPSPSIMYSMIFSVKNTYQFCPKTCFLVSLASRVWPCFCPVYPYTLGRDNEQLCVASTNHSHVKWEITQIPAFGKLWLGRRQGLLFIAMFKIGFWQGWTGLDGRRLGLASKWRLPRPSAHPTVRDNFKGQEKSLVLFAVLYAVFSKFQRFFFQITEIWPGLVTVRI